MQVCNLLSAIVTGNEQRLSPRRSLGRKFAAGEKLETAVLNTSKNLLKGNEPDWANYILFGGGSFRPVVG